MATGRELLPINIPVKAGEARTQSSSYHGLNAAPVRVPVSLMSSASGRSCHAAGQPKPGCVRPSPASCWPGKDPDQVGIVFVELRRVLAVRSAVPLLHHTLHGIESRLTDECLPPARRQKSEGRYRVESGAIALGAKGLNPSAPTMTRGSGKSPTNFSLPIVPYSAFSPQLVRIESTLLTKAVPNRPVAVSRQATGAESEVC